MWSVRDQLCMSRNWRKENMMTLNYCKRDLIQITPFHKKGKHYQNSRQHSRLSRSKGFQQLFNCAVLSRCDPMDRRLPGSSVHGILQARVLEWVAISFCRGSSQPRDRTRVSRIPGRRFNLWATREAIREMLIRRDVLSHLQLRWHLQLGRGW